MKRKNFDELLEGAREMRAIIAGKEKPAAQYVVNRIRAKYEVSQSQFAMMLGVPLKTLQKWEQVQRSPGGRAAALLRIADKHPDAF